MPFIGEEISWEKYLSFGFTSDKFYIAIIIPICVLFIALCYNLFGYFFSFLVKWSNRKEKLRYNLQGRVLYWFVEEYSIFFLLIAFFNLTHMNRTPGGYFSFALCILFLALYLFTVTFLLIIFACWKQKTWPKSLSNVKAGVKKSRVSMLLKISLFYGKWFIFAFLISMDKEI